jgi:hypothetical protein
VTSSNGLPLLAYLPQEMVSVNPVVQEWVVASISAVFLAMQWSFMFGGLTGKFGYKIGESKEPQKAVDLRSVSILRFWTRIPRKSRIAYSLFAAVSFAFLASLGTFLRKFLMYSSGDDLMPQGICEFYCRGSLTFYGGAKLIIYYQLYLKCVNMAVLESRRYGKKLLQGLVGFGILAFVAAIVSGVVQNTCIREKGGCICLTPFEQSFSFVIIDWYVSATLLVCFTIPVLKQMQINLNANTHSLWKSIATQQFVISIFMLAVSPACVGLFIYLDVFVPPDQRMWTAHAFLTTDVWICCYAQGYASKKIWVRGGSCCGNKVPEGEYPESPEPMKHSTIHSPRMNDPFINKS